MTAVHDRAIEAHQAGLCVLPVANDQTKRPAVPWRDYQRTRPDIDTLHVWFAEHRGHQGLGVVCGAVSGNLELLEAEGRAVDDGTVDRYLTATKAAGLPDLYDGWVERSPSGGLHFLYLVDGIVAGNTKLAATADRDVLLETRGEGGFVVIAPTPGSYHQSGRPWTLEHGARSAMLTLTLEQVALFHGLARTLDQTVPKTGQTPAVHKTGPTGSGEGRPGDQYNHQRTWPEILEPHGWTYLFEHNNIGYWRRPGKQDGVSATTNSMGTDRLKCFTTSTAFATDTTYDKLGAYTALEHAGDLQAAVSHLAAAGYGNQQPAAADGPWGTGHIADVIDMTSRAKDDVPAGRHITLTPASTIAMKVARWVWQDRIPQGALTLLGGREGIGKSTYAYDLASDITRGKVPGVFHGTPRPVLVAATEDSWEHTINPRLAAAGADRTIVYRIDVETETTDYGILTLPHDLDDLADHVRRTAAGLILLDPLLSRLDPRLDTHKDADVRKALEPITRLADATACAVIGLIHVNKSGAVDPLTTLMGSRAFSAVARAVLFIMVDPDDHQYRLLGQPKNNLGRSDLPTLRFHIVNTCAGLSDEGEEVWVGKIEWAGESSMTLDEALDVATRPGPDPEQLDAAAVWLDDYLKSKGGTYASREIKAAAKAAGHADATLKRAKQKLGVVHDNTGFPRITYWTLPTKSSGQPLSAVGSQSSRSGEPEPTEPTASEQDLVGSRYPVSSSSSLPPRARADCNNDQNDHIERLRADLI